MSRGNTFLNNKDFNDKKKLWLATVFYSHGTEFAVITGDNTDSLQFILSAEDENDANQQVLAWARDFNRRCKNSRKVANFITQRVCRVDGGKP